MAYFFKYSTQYLLIVLILTGTLFSIEIDSAEHAVDVAGKQRMFTQRMLKDYAMIGMENSFGKPEEDLIKIMENFENHLEALHNYTKNKKIKISTEKIKEIWLPIKKRLKSEPKKEFVGKLQEDLELLLKESNHATNLFAKDTGEKSGEIIDISGRQRMLSQRMAGLYMLKVWGVDDKKFEEKMKSSMKLFKDSLERLKKSDLNTVEIRELLIQVEKSFMFFEIMNRSFQTFVPALIYKKSNDILKNMNSVTKLYVAVSKK